MAQKTTSLWDELMRLRDAERDRLAKGTVVASGEKAIREITPMGIVRWYTHPSLEEPVLRTFICWVQEIPPDSRSGRMKHQGGRVHYVWHGRGYTVVDGVSHEWEEGDVIFIPAKPYGVEFQHFNSGGEVAELISAELNLVGIMGVDKGVAFEIIEPAPEYRAP